jgi:ubiquinone biosynthesis protein COQ9
MHSSLEKLKDALDNLSDAVNEAIPEGENTLLLDKNGISYPALYPGDLVDLVNYLTDRLDGVNLDSLEDDEIKEINFIINKIKK